MKQIATLSKDDRISLVQGGPFHSILERLGLTATDGLPTTRVAIGAAVVAWSLPALLVAAQSLQSQDFSGWSFFTDYTVYARFLIAIGVMISTERHADRRLTQIGCQFRKAKLVDDESLEAFDSALSRADRRTGSAWVEILLLFMALIVSGITTGLDVELAGTSWNGVATGDGVALSWAGMATRWISNPLFLFLTLRWSWRFLLWSELLLRISRLPLRLTPLSPDRSAGLGFLALYPTIFYGPIWAISCVVASSYLKDLAFQEHESTTVWLALGIWLAICLVFSLGPLLAFARLLYGVRVRAILDYGQLSSEYYLAFQDKWIGGERNGGDLLGDAEVSSSADLNATVAAVREMRVVPIDSSVVVGILLAAGIPMLAVVGTQIPLAEILKWVAGAVF